MLTRWGLAPLLLLLLLLLAAGSRAQSGDSDTEPKISCTSHIAETNYSLACQLIGVDDDDEDSEGDRIVNMTLCYVTGGRNRKEKCLNSSRDAIMSKDMNPVPVWNLTVQLASGGQLSTTVDLKKIVKPRSPQVWNVTFDQDAGQAVIYIHTPYTKRDYLALDNQLFQLHIATPGINILQNISSQNFLQIDLQHLHKPSEYRVRVRAIPQMHIQGSWSEWSEAFSFRPPAAVQKQDENQVEVMYMLIVCIVSVVVVTFSIVALWKNRIFTYMWPSIPHPKQTLVQICKPNKGLLLNFNPEVFSHLKVFPLETPSCEEAEPSLSPAAAGSCSGSTQSSDCRSTTSVSTEELEISALLSRSSSDGEDSLLSNNPSPVPVLQREEPEPEGGVNQQEEAYVTMSSFYQIK